MGISPSKLPEDIVIDIISRLPVKSLLRFRTISKSWLSIISNPQFIQSHCLIAAQKKPSILVSQILYAPTNDFEYVFMPKIFPEYCDFIGCCNGIVCLAMYNGNIYLWNPSTKQYKNVPEPEKYPNEYGRILGFGYDSISNDYKILCIQDQLNDPVNLVRLFSTNEGFWREIRVNIQLCGTRYKNCGTVTNGFLYVEALDENFDTYEENEIISFDLHNEVFGVVPLPTWQDKRSNVLDFNGSAAIMYLEYSGGESDYQGLSLWTLEDGGEVSWIKKFTIETDELCWIQRPWFYNGIWVDFCLGDGTFYGRNYFCEPYSPMYHAVSHMWYNYEKKEGNCFDLDEGRFPHVMKYTESLVSIKGFESTANL